MKKVLAFAGSISKNSINKQLVNYTSTLLKDTNAELIDMNDYQARLYSVDEEAEGIPDNMISFSEALKSYDGFIVSLAEHNGSYASGFKNTLDWLSRIDKKIFNDKPVLLMSSSPGGRGGANVLAAANAYFPRLGANIVANFSLPDFYQTFQDEKIHDEELSNALKEAVHVFESRL